MQPPIQTPIQSPNQSPKEASQLAENILLFCRTLRRAGMSIGPGQVIEACTAVMHAGIDRRDDFYWALRSVLVTQPAQFRLFDQAFHVYFRNPRLLERMLSLLMPELERDSTDTSGEAALRRLLEAIAEHGDLEGSDPIVEIDQSDTYSRREVLRTKDFEQMSIDEQRQAKQLLREELHAIRDVATRRFRPNQFGHRYDLRRSMRLMLRNNGQLIELARKSRQVRPPALVLICDISGSMSRYSRIFLRFAHTLSLRYQSVHSFVFGTRLTNISRRLKARDIDRAMSHVSDEVRDWDGGTRIAECVAKFNVDWSRRVLAGNATVILLSDGLERDPESDLDFQMQRLRRSCRQLIWLNPLLRFDHFEARAIGIRKMLPHVDLFLPAHNVESLLDLGRVLSGPTAAADRMPEVAA